MIFVTKVIPLGVHGNGKIQSNRLANRTDEVDAMIAHRPEQIAEPDVLDVRRQFDADR